MAERRCRRQRADEEAGKEQRRGGAQYRLLLLALSGAFLVLVVSVNHGRSHHAAGYMLQRQMQAARSATIRRVVREQQEVPFSPSKRHRKLENGASLGEEQQVLASTADGLGKHGQGSLDEPDTAARLESEGGGEDGAGAAAADAASAGDAGGWLTGSGGAGAATSEGSGQQQEEGQAQAQPAAGALPGQSQGTSAGGSSDRAQPGTVSSDPNSGWSSNGWSSEQREVVPQPGARLKSPYHRALESCDTLACVKQAAKQPRYRGQFLFPHFFIIGWQKSATTSLFHHLRDHPEVLCPSEKEPEFFSDDCHYDPDSCPLDRQKQYIEETLRLDRALRHNLNGAMFEGSTHYAREGQRIAPGMARAFPWARLIASLREPISRAVSMLAHNMDRRSIGCLTKRDVFGCLVRTLPALNYTEPIQAWLDAFPREQVMLLQYERLTAPDQVADHLRAVKSFLGVNPELPANQLGRNNTREARLGKKPQGWPITRQHYQALIDIARRDAQGVADIVTRHGLGDGKLWLYTWEQAWQANLNSCNAQDECLMQLT